MTITAITVCAIPADDSTNTSDISQCLPGVTADVKSELQTIICTKEKYDYQARVSTIYRDRLSVSRPATGSVLQPTSIPLVVVFMHLNSSGCAKPRQQTKLFQVFYVQLYSSEILIASIQG